jgi:hypothetical protein
MAEGIEVRIPEAASPEAALPKKDLLFMIIVLIFECLKLWWLLTHTYWWQKIGINIRSQISLCEWNSPLSLKDVRSQWNIEIFGNQK